MAPWFGCRYGSAAWITHPGDALRIQLLDAGWIEGVGSRFDLVAVTNLVAISIEELRVGAMDVDLVIVGQAVLIGVDNSGWLFGRFG